MGSPRPHPTLTSSPREAGHGKVAEWRRLAPYHLYRAGSAVAQSLPAPLATIAAERAGIIAGRRSKGRRAMISRHLSRIHGAGMAGRELEAAADRAFASYGRYWMESFRLPINDAADLEAGMCYEGIGHLEAALALGRGAIVAMPHLGAWDWGGAWLSATGFPITVVAETLDPPELFEWFTAWRQKMGLTVVPLGPDAGSSVSAALRRGEVVGLLCDRDLTGDGVEVEFFDERTKLPGGPATLALRTGAAVIPACVLFEGDHRRGIVLPPLDTSRRDGLRADLARITQDLADALASLIRRAPEQWHVFQPNWPSDFEDQAG